MVCRSFYARNRFFWSCRVQKKVGALLEPWAFSTTNIKSFIAIWWRHIAPFWKMLKAKKMRASIFAILMTPRHNISHKSFCVQPCKVRIKIAVWLLDYFIRIKITCFFNHLSVLWMNDEGHKFYVQRWWWITHHEENNVAWQSRRLGHFSFSFR